MDRYLQIIYGVHHLRAAPAALCFGWMSSPSYHIRFIKVPLCLAISRSFLDVGGPVRKRYIMSFTVAPPCWRSMVAVYVCTRGKMMSSAHSLQLYSNIYILISQSFRPKLSSYGGRPTRARALSQWPRHWVPQRRTPKGIWTKSEIAYPTAISVDV